MILSRLSHTLRQQRRASLDDLATALQAAPEAVEAMLATLERKGRVRRLPAGSSCGKSCCACDPKRLQIYEWAEPSDRTA
ncbi:MAG: FeoC-like transcriptional regulator [Rhodocyclales bacterium]|nr:FeoC-like transcriptional regulator [Rhodocyclales bacterium]